MAEFRCNPSLTCISANSNEKSLSVPAEKERENKGVRVMNENEMNEINM